MPQRNVYHIVPQDDRWAVRLEGSPTVSAETETRGEAVEAAAEFLRLLGTGRVVMHDADGRIETAYSLSTLQTREERHRWGIAAGVLGVAFVIGLAVAVAKR